MVVRFFLPLLLVVLLGFVPAASGQAEQPGRWDFTVYVDDKKIGTHEFSVTEGGGYREVRSEATFRYRFLFIPAYRYDHRAAERWSNNCLTELRATTKTNGEEMEVLGERTTDGFLVDRGAGSEQLPPCVMTFAYWNPEFLEQDRLLNPQTGEFVDVTIEEIGTESLQVRGEQVRATRFRLTTKNADMTLWYSEDDEWLGLESQAEGGRTIRYELS